MEMKAAVPVTVTVGLVALIVLGLVYTATQDTLTSTEAVLLTVLAAAASMLVSWLATHQYSQHSERKAVEQAKEESTENTRNLGKRAVEKVLNLSNELRRLTMFLEEAEREASELGENKGCAVLLGERVKASIHNLKTLKSVNDTFLSDWRQVIGREFDKQWEIDQKIERLRGELDEKIEKRMAMQPDAASKEEVAALERSIRETRAAVKQQMVQRPFKIGSNEDVAIKSRVVDFLCPECGAHTLTLAKARIGGVAKVDCSGCDGIFLGLLNQENTLTDIVRMNKGKKRSGEERQGEEEG